MKTSAPPSAIETERLRLFAPTMAMAEAIFAAIDAERERLQTYLPWVRHVTTLADEQQFISRTAQSWKSRENFAYAMFSKTDGAYVGNSGFVKIVWEHAYAEVGYWLREHYEGRGLVTEATRALEQAAQKMGLHRLEIHCSTCNKRSTGVPERLGYALEGVCREDFFCQTENRWHDTAIFGKIIDKSS